MSGLDVSKLMVPAALRGLEERGDGEGMYLQPGPHLAGLKGINPLFGLTCASRTGRIFL